jgi:hypothetical protein
MNNIPELDEINFADISRGLQIENIVYNESLSIKDRWYVLQTNIIFHRALELGISLQDKTPSDLLDDIELLYMNETIRAFGLDVSTGWGSVLALYLKNFKAEYDELLQNEHIQTMISEGASKMDIRNAVIQIYGEDTVNEIRKKMLAEYRREVLARLLQLNKFTATPQEVLDELNKLFEI